MKSKESKRSLFLSVISLLLCSAMLIGNTFAWFTAVVKTEKNEIVVGNLDVEMEYSLDFEDWKTVNTTTKLFNEDARWQPGYSEVVYLKVKNAGDLSLRYQLSIKINEEQVAINKNDRIFKLSDYIQVGAVKNIENGYSSNAAAILAVENDAIALSTFSKNGVIEAGGANQYFALVVFMPESVGNAANYRGDAPNIDFGVSLYATQIGGDIESDTPTVVFNEDVSVFSGAQAEQANESIESIWTEEDTTYMTVSENSPFNVLSEGDIFYLEGDENSPFGDAYIGKIASVINNDTSTFNLRNTAVSSGTTYTIVMPMIDEVFSEIDIDFDENIAFNNENMKVVPLVDGVEQIQAISPYSLIEGENTSISQKVMFDTKIDILKLFGLKTDTGYSEELTASFKEKIEYSEGNNVLVYAETEGINNHKSYHRDNCRWVESQKCEKISLIDAVEKQECQPCIICKPPLLKDSIFKFTPNLKLIGQFGLENITLGMTLKYNEISGIEECSTYANMKFVSDLKIEGNVNFSFGEQATSIELADSIKLEGLNKKLLPLVGCLYDGVKVTPVTFINGNETIEAATKSVPLSIGILVYLDASGQISLGMDIGFKYERELNYNRTIIRNNQWVDEGDNSEDTSNFGSTISGRVEGEFDIHLGASIQAYLLNVNILDLATIKVGFTAKGNGQIQYSTGNPELVEIEDDFNAKIYLKFFELKIKFKIILDVLDFWETQLGWDEFTITMLEYVLKEWGNEKSSIWYSPNATLRVFDIENQEYDNYIVTIKGEQKDGTPYENSFHVDTTEPIKLNAPEGSYKLTVTDSQNTELSTYVIIILYEKSLNKDLKITTSWTKPDEISSSQGLAYTLNSGGTSYSVSGIGTCKSTKLIIPETYDGKPVTAITAEAFKNCTQLISVVVPASVKEIGKGAFSGCSSIESMTIPFVGASPSPGSALHNEKNCFGYIFGSEEYDGSYCASQYTFCIDSKSFYIPETLKNVTMTGNCINYGSFSCLNIPNIQLTGNVSSIPSDAFANNIGITEMRIPAGCTEIGYTWDGLSSGGVFSGCENLQKVYIPINLKNIDYGCFNYCNSLTDVYYEGSKDDWEAINIDDGNSYLINATIHYNYRDESTAPGINKDDQIGDIITFGEYEQDNNISNGKEPIEWFVLDVQNGKALVISKYALDGIPYNTSRNSITWETCTLRTWLNSDFINSAFSAEEQALIQTVTVSADPNPFCSTDPGNATEDKVFLLSMTEANKYFSYDSRKLCQATAYAVAQDAYANSSNGNCCWWLRSPGVEMAAAFVYDNGDIAEGGCYVDDGNGAVRPAMWIDLNYEFLIEP